MRKIIWAVVTALAGSLAGAATAAAAEGAEGMARPWQMGFQEAATPIMHQVTAFNSFVTAIITVIAVFVLVLLVYVMVRFNERRNPTPSRTSHNTVLEVVWTVAPILILVVIAIPSFRLLFAQYALPPADVTIKATGNQWYWTYEYPDAGAMTFDSVMVADKDLKPGQPRLLTVDNPVVVPVNKNVHVLVTAADVIHDWAVPSFGIKLDAVPGRVLTTWFRAEKTGVFYGQCSELCGKLHAFMPIEVRVVSEEDYAKWLEQAKQKFASNDDAREIAALPPQGSAPRAGGND